MLIQADFIVQSLVFACVFPNSLRWARPLERTLSKLSLGAQFQNHGPPTTSPYKNRVVRGARVW